MYDNEFVQFKNNNFNREEYVRKNIIFSFNVVNLNILMKSKK